MGLKNIEHMSLRNKTCQYHDAPLRFIGTSKLWMPANGSLASAGAGEPTSGRPGARPVGSRRMRSRMRRSAHHPVVSPTANIAGPTGSATTQVCPLLRKVTSPRCGASSSPTRGPASAHLGWPLRSGERGGAWVDLDQVHAHQPARLGHLLGDIVDLAVGEAAWAVINYQ